VEEMNRVLINNWNYTVKPEDSVFFVGDFAFGKPDEFFPKLNGKIRFISGNHDKDLDPKELHKTLSCAHKGIDFFFIHETLKRQEKIPDGFEGWIIHGHHHNNHPRKFPFFCPEKKRVNVSVELTKYTPVALDYICDLIEGKQKKIISL
jgi:calcineurin-like phosphoesterase family protein